MSEATRKDNYVPDDPALSPGHLHYRVEMWFMGQRLGVALVRNVWGERTARRAALKGIATVILPMSDVDHVKWSTHKETST